MLCLVTETRRLRGIERFADDIKIYEDSREYTDSRLRIVIDNVSSAITQLVYDMLKLRSFEQHTSEILLHFRGSVWRKFDMCKRVEVCRSQPELYPYTGVLVSQSDVYIQDSLTPRS